MRLDNNLYKLRIKKLSDKLVENNFDGLFISNLSNIFYLSGLDIDNCFVLITPQKQYIFTDSRFKQEISSVDYFFDKVIVSNSILKSVVEICKGIGIKNLVVESNDLTIDKFNYLFKNLNSVNLIVDKDLVSNLRIIKSEKEIKDIKKSIYILSEIYDIIGRLVKDKNMTEWNLANELDYILKKDFESCFAFPPILACGDNSSLPHAKVSKRRIFGFEYVLVDIGVKFKGYCSDLTRIYVLNKMTFEQENIYKLLLKHQIELLKTIKPGIKLSQLDEISRDKLSHLGYSNNIKHSIGHGVGIDIHERPFISANCNEIEVAEPGMVFTVEPGLYFPGKWGMRIEDMVLVTESGNEVLTSKIPKIEY